MSAQGPPALAGHCREEHRKPLDVRTTLLQPGDVLLLETKADWAERFMNDKGFVLLNPVKNSNPPKRTRGLLSVSLGIIMVLTQVGCGCPPNWHGVKPTAALRIIPGAQCRAVTCSVLRVLSMLWC